MAINLTPWLRRNGHRNGASAPIEGPKTLMAIMAHPDDIDFTAAGTIAKLCAEGWTVYYVLATSGDKGTHGPESRQELAATREEEQREAARVLGVKDVIFLGYPDGFLEATQELRGQVVRLLRQYKVDVALTWDAFRPGFNHSDHRNIGIATRDAIYPAVREHLYYEEHTAEGLAAHPVNELLLAGTDKPDYFVDISGFIDKKVDAMLCHRSQVNTQDRDELKKRLQGGWRGETPGVESFKRVRLGRQARQEQEGGTRRRNQPAPAGAD